MGIYNVHAGHCPQGKGAYGAVGVLQESVEDRKVKDEVIRLLRAAGHTVYDCTCEENTTKDGCLAKIVAKCNQHKVDLDISIHLNSGRNDYKGDNSTGGTEVWNYDIKTKAISDHICANIANALGIRNRGTKYDTKLYVLRNTKSPALLVECAFVDDKDDANRWDVNKCAKAIVEGILNTTVATPPSKPAEPQKPSAPAKPAAPSGDPGIVFEYAVRAGGKTYPPVKNLNDFAGVRGKAITDVAIKVSKGSVKYRVHVKGGGWLPYVTGYNWNDHKNGYAGNGKVIDAIEVYYSTPADIANKYGYQKAQYRVSPVNGNYYAWQFDNEKGGGQDGYAGDFGVAIDRFQLF